MSFVWRIKKRDINCVNALLDKHASNEMIWERVDNNLATHRKKITKEQFWQGMIAMRLTTQQKYSPGSLAYNFNHKKPYPLSYRAVSQQKDIKKFVTQTLREHRANRFPDAIGIESAKNFHNLTEGGKWQELLNQVNRLTTLQSKEVEREICDYLRLLLSGIGPKQARNILQYLGLTRFEIPIDSRIIKWLCSETTCPKEFSYINLSIPLGYEFILDQIQNLCEACNEFPCIVDAAVFSDVDGTKWGIRPNAKRNWPRPN